MMNDKKILTAFFMILTIIYINIGLPIRAKTRERMYHYEFYFN